MKMTKKIKWRLSNLPTSEELRGLVVDGLMTKEEAREVLFNEDDEKARDVKSLESEIKFLRELVERLSKNSSTIVETIRYIEKPYVKYPWYTPYYTWCNAVSRGVTYYSGNNSSALLANVATNAVGSIAGAVTSFGNIQTF